MTRLLIVDDSALMRKFLGRVFEAVPGFEIAYARDGMEALRAVAEFRPDVVTLDIEMPNMDGLTCLDRIMVENPCPVVMVSALTEKGAEATLIALATGAVDFIAKPEGTISLHADDLAPMIIERVKTAATARIKRSTRLAERLRHQAGPAPRAAAKRLSVPVRSAEPATRAAVAAEDCMVLVGTSTGGPPALDALLSGLPASFGWPVLIAQHMPPSFTGPLARRLDKQCALRVVEVTGPMPIEAGTVYIGKGDTDLVVSRRNGQLLALAMPPAAEQRWHPSVDRLVRSALEHVPASRLVGILMTGMGNDGAEALTALREAGGQTIAEAEETAIVWGMPGDLVRRGGASQVVRLPQIASRLLELSPWR